MITTEAMGLDDAQELTEFKLRCLTEYTGVYYRGSRREDEDAQPGETNATIVTYLAAGGRDLRTFSDEIAELLGQGWKQSIENSANSFVKKNGQFKKVWAKRTDWERAKVAAGRAWRACGKAVLQEMARRVEGMIAASSNGSESPARKVTENYAEWRAGKYGVPHEIVYKATGQLIADLNPADPGVLTLSKGTAMVGREEFAANIKSGLKEIQGLVIGTKGKMFKF